MRNFIKNFKTNMLNTTVAARTILSDNRGESAIGTAIFCVPC